MVRSQADGALRKASASAIGTDGHAEVVLHAAVPGFVVGSVQVTPFFVGHGLTPAEKWQRIGSNRVPQLPGSALDDLADLVCHQGRLCRLLERRGEQVCEA